MKEETKTNKRQCPVSLVQVQNLWWQSSPNATRKTIEERICVTDGFKSGAKDRGSTEL